jgi:uncharacterized DUF497 family protein
LCSEKWTYKSSWSALTFADPDPYEDEERAITIGRSALQRVLFVAHTERHGRLRVISARRATMRERRQYEEGIDEATS